ncbi:MAG: PAS domain-containing protein, partial [Candidatus Latescibacterota bacterium]
MNAPRSSATEREVVQGLRKKVWSMHDRGDMGDILVAVHDSLKKMAVPFTAYSINLLDGPADFPTAHRLDEEGKWVENSVEEMAVILRFCRAGEVSYRADLEKEDPYNERERISDSYDNKVRCVLDVPFSHGTLAVNSTEANAFSDADISALRSLAEVLSEGFHRLQDLKEIARHRHQLASEVAERQQAESSLRHSQVHFDNIIDNLAAGILVTDLADTILFSNERMA